ncbi:carbohydrate ABC transporter permease [Paenibacillus sp. HJGM_3]|uniref:carbohydrate ABC transporter permease n=1 Tax=Paenibacillus sp. HJGM_3 TaxID=3379816 RepID=UPI00385A44B6
MYHKSAAYRVFSLINHAMLAVLALVCIAPLVHILAVSLSGKAAASANLVGMWPIDFTWQAYGKSIANPFFLDSLWIAVKRTVLGTAVGMTVVTLAAYPLSKSELHFRPGGIYKWYFVFTMLFNGGMIANYLLIMKLGLINSLWALILPGAVSVWNMILLLNFFRTVPKELEEACLIDGAGHFRTLFYVYLPISLPALATLSLFTMVSHWNAWFDGLIYMTKFQHYPLATFLQTIIVQQDFDKMNVNKEDLENISQRTVKAAQIFIGALPILLVYPFLQKFFIKGIVLGAIKE